jgi:hypothetical protein
MSDIERRPSSRPSRRHREQRAYRLVVLTGAFAAAFVVALVLAIAGVLGSGPAVFFAIVAALSGFMLRRTLRP